MHLIVKIVDVALLGHCVFDLEGSKGSKQMLNYPNIVSEVSNKNPSIVSYINDIVIIEFLNIALKSKLHIHSFDFVIKFLLMCLKDNKNCEL